MPVTAPFMPIYSTRWEDGVLGGLRIDLNCASVDISPPSPIVANAPGSCAGGDDSVGALFGQLSGTHSTLQSAATTVESAASFDWRKMPVQTQEGGSGLGDGGRDARSRESRVTLENNGITDLTSNQKGFAGWGGPNFLNGNTNYFPTELEYGLGGEVEGISHRQTSMGNGAGGQIDNGMDNRGGLGWQADRELYFNRGADSPQVALPSLRSIWGSCSSDKGSPLGLNCQVAIEGGSSGAMRAANLPSLYSIWGSCGCSEDGDLSAGPISTAVAVPECPVHTRNCSQMGGLGSELIDCANSRLVGGNPVWESSQGSIQGSGGITRTSLGNRGSTDLGCLDDFLHPEVPPGFEQVRGRECVGTGLADRLPSLHSIWGSCDSSCSSLASGTNSGGLEEGRQSAMDLPVSEGNIVCAEGRYFYVAEVPYWYAMQVTGGQPGNDNSQPVAIHSPAPEPDIYVPQSDDRVLGSPYPQFPSLKSVFGTCDASNSGANIQRLGGGMVEVERREGYPAFPSLTSIFGACDGEQQGQSCEVTDALGIVGIGEEGMTDMGNGAMTDRLGPVGDRCPVSQINDAVYVNDKFQPEGTVEVGEEGCANLPSLYSVFGTCDGSDGELSCGSTGSVLHMNNEEIHRRVSGHCVLNDRQLESDSGGCMDEMQGVVVEPGQNCFRNDASESYWLQVPDKSIADRDMNRIGERFCVNPTGGGPGIDNGRHAGVDRCGYDTASTQGDKKLLLSKLRNGTIVVGGVLPSPPYKTVLGTYAVVHPASTSDIELDNDECMDDMDLADGCSALLREESQDPLFDAQWNVIGMINSLMDGQDPKDQWGGRCRSKGCGEGRGTSIFYNVLKRVLAFPKQHLLEIQELGEGTFGKVTLCCCPGRGQVAVKWFKTDQRKGLRPEFQHECALLASLPPHENILKFVGVVRQAEESNEILGFMTQFCDQGSLAQHIRRNSRPVSFINRVHLAMQVARGMAYLHANNICHFDLKPENVFLFLTEGGALQVQIGDFGLARRLVEGSVKAPSTLRGTLPYLSPEMVDSTPLVDEKVDVWAFGAMLCEMASMRLPYSGMESDEILLGLKEGWLKPQLPDGVEWQWEYLTNACLRRDPRERPGFHEIGEFLRNVGESQGWCDLDPMYAMA